MNTTSISSNGSSDGAWATSWSAPVPHDTSTEAAAIEAGWWSGLTPGQRGQWWQRRQRTFLEMRLAYLRSQHPAESRQELLARVVEQRFADNLPPAFLEKALQAIRDYQPPEDAPEPR